MRWSLTSRQQSIIGLALIVGLLGWSTYRMARRLAVEPYIDFQAFYLAADAARTGADPYRAGTEMYIYLPMLAAWMAPLSKLTITQASWIWFGLTVAAMMTCLALVWATLRDRLLNTMGSATNSVNLASNPSSRWGEGSILAIGITLLIWQTQCRWQFEQGQTDWLMLTGICVALYALDRSPAIVGMALGFAINIKYLPLALVAYLAIRGRWKHVAWCGVGIVTWALLPALVYGWDQNLVFLKQGLAGLGKLVGIQIEGQAGAVFPLTYDRSITIPSMWARVAETYGQSMIFVAGMTAITGLIVAAVAWIVYRQYGARLFAGRGGAWESREPVRRWVFLEYLCMMVVMVLFSPQAQMRHYFLLLPMVLTTSTLAIAGRTQMVRGLAVAALVVGVIGSIGADLLTPFGHRETWKYLSGAALSTLTMSILTLAAGLRHTCRSEQHIPEQQPQTRQAA
jgi:hypothetical protein